MKIVIDIDDTHMPVVRQCVHLHGPAVRLDFGHFPALLPGIVVGVVEESLASPDDSSPLYCVTPLEG